MRPMIIRGFTNILKAPPGWNAEKHGPIVDLHIRGIVEHGLHAMQSIWLPSREDIALINAGCPIMLEVLGRIDKTGHPPVMVKVGAVSDLQVMAANQNPPERKN